VALDPEEAEQETLISLEPENKCPSPRMGKEGTDGKERTR